jgi:hypothetical protein
MPFSMDFSGDGSGAEDNENQNASTPTGPQISPINPPASPSFSKDGLLSFSPVHSDSPAISPVTQVDPVTVHGGKPLAGLLDAVGDVAGKIWGSPMTLFGLAAGGAGYLAGTVVGTHPKVQFGNNAIQFTGIPNMFGKDEVGTLGNVQLYEGKSTPTTTGRHYVDGFPDMTIGQHEEAHTYQYQTLGSLFLPWWFALGGESAKNPFEKSADYYGAGKGGPFSAFDEGLLGNFKNFKK